MASTKLRELGNIMRGRAWSLLAALAVFAVALAAACTTPSDPTNTPSPPTPTPTETPTPAPTPTSSPTPTLAPPTPTPTHTPTPSPTPTPIPPTPTPTPTLGDVVNAAQAAMVRISSGGQSWSGVLIDDAGLILSTSRDLGNAPVVSFSIEGGASGNAWVIGRDDARDLAIYEILEPQGPYPAVGISGAQPPTVGDELAVLSYPAGRGGSLERLNTRIIGVRQDFNTGAFYLQIQTQAQAGTQGGTLIDTSGEVRGLRMREEQMIALGFGQVGEVYAIASNALVENTPRLRDGYLQISTTGSLGLPQDSSAPPGLPVIYHGTVSISGAVVTDQPRVYLKLTKPGLPDLWFSTPVNENGNYVIAVQASSSYGAGSVEFWAIAQKANETPTFQSAGSPHTQNITFP